ncbi:hypothetical protein [Thalassotalea fusca]
MKVTGFLEKINYAPGSKSENLAVVINIDYCDGTTEALNFKKPYLIRKIGANPFQNTEFDAAIGHKIEAEAEVTENSVLVKDWHLLE